MKPTQGPSFGRVLVYDIKAQRLGIFAFILAIAALGLGIYGLLNKSSNFAGEIFLLIFSFGLAVGLIWRFRFFRKVYENGNTVWMKISSTRKTGDEITISGHYEYKKESYHLSTTVQKNRRTKLLKRGDQIFLVIDQSNPKNTYVQDLFTPDSPEEIRQLLTQTTESEVLPSSDFDDDEIEEQPIELPKLVQPLDVPGGCQVEDLGQGLKITFVERQWGFLIWIFVGMILTLIGVSTRGDPADAPFSFLVPLLIGIVIIYAGLVKLINHNEIIVTSNKLRVLSAPLPALVKRPIDSAQVSQLIVNEIDDDDVPQNYQLNIRLQDGRTVLLTKTVNGNTAEFIKQRIEHWLGIQKQAIVEKTSRTNKGRLTG